MLQYSGNFTQGNGGCSFPNNCQVMCVNYVMLITLLFLYIFTLILKIHTNNSVAS